MEENMFTTSDKVVLGISAALIIAGALVARSAMKNLEKIQIKKQLEKCLDKSKEA